MKAIAVFPAERAIRLVDHPIPRLSRRDDVLIRMLEVGVCGTDREIARFEYGSPPDESPYLVLGHESLGEVVETGAGVRDVHAGDLVVTMVRRPCGDPACPACAIDRSDFCVTGRFTERGIKQVHGFMTEQIVEDQRYVVVVPRALRNVGVLLEPLTIAEKALIQLPDVQDRLPWLTSSATNTGAPAPRAVVLGAGPVGLLGALALRVRGFDTIVYSRQEPGGPQATWVAAVGARYVSAVEVPIAKLGEVTGDIDLIYEATGAAKVAFEAVPALGANGVFIFTGVPAGKRPIELDAGLVMRDLVLKNQLVYGTVNAGRDAFERAVADLVEMQRRWPDPLAALITGRYPPEAFHDLLLGDKAGIKQVIQFADPS